MKEGSLFCFIVMRSTEPGCFRLCSWCLWKALDGGGVHGLGSMTFGLCGVQKFLNIPKKKTRFLEGKFSGGCGNTWANGTGHTSSQTTIEP